MIFEYIDHKGDKKEITLEKSVKTDKNWEYIDFKDKLEFIKKFVPRYKSGQKIVLFDKNHKQLFDFYNSIDISKIASNLGDEYKLLFFTSGSSGFPVGAFKSKNNLKQAKIVSHIKKERHI